MTANKKHNCISGHTIIRLKDVCEIIGFSAKHIRHLERTGQFPPRVQLGPKSVGFKLIDICAWVDARLVSRDGTIPQNNKTKGEQ
jgi:predicted DNA-binding transcriptional regulator AlpA